MLHERILADLEYGARLTARVLQHRGQRTDGCHEDPVVGGGEDHVVEGEVGIHEPRDVALIVRGAHPLEQDLELGDVLGRGARSRELGRPGLEHHAHVEQIQRRASARSPAARVPDDGLEPRPLVDRRDAVAAARHRHDDALRLEEAHPLAQRQPRDTEKSGEIGLGRQRLPRDQSPGDDLVEQPVDDGLRAGDALGHHGDNASASAHAPPLRPSG